MRTRATITLAAMLLALTACSSTDDSADPAPSSTKTANEAPSPNEDSALNTAVQAYTEAYFKGDADTAYDALSKRCQGKVTPEMFSAVVKQAAADYGPDHKATALDAEVSGDLARVSYKVAGLPKLDQAQQPWAREGGAWKYDAC